MPWFVIPAHAGIQWFRFLTFFSAEHLPSRKHETPRISEHIRSGFRHSPE
ncbi:MAG: hypothetical protein OXG62_03315 [Nitrospinae bacterium]|nr:hypothetical protein [Nitrospinota bacterium]